jgi:hypothetical protein
MLRVYCSWPGRVCDDEFSAHGGEGAIGHVDRDALLALGLQAINQQCDVEIAAGGAEAGTVADEGSDPVVDLHPLNMLLLHSSSDEFQSESLARRHMARCRMAASRSARRA